MARTTRRQFTGMMLAGAAAALPIRGFAQGAKKLTLYMGPPDKTCAAVAQGFEKKSGIKTTFLRLSAGEAINRIRAEKNSPQASLLYGISPTDAITFLATPLVLFLTAAIAVLVPARRARAIRPMDALRLE